MKINADAVIRLRKARSWSQDELAIAAGLNLRTVQRVENEASASLQSKKALAAAFDIDARSLDDSGPRLKPCPVCGSDEVYQHRRFFAFGAAGGETLLPGLGNRFFSAAQIRPTLCADCGHVRLVADEASRKNVKASKQWDPV